MLANILIMVAPNLNAKTKIRFLLSLDCYCDVVVEYRVSSSFVKIYQGNSWFEVTVIYF